MKILMNDINLPGGANINTAGAPLTFTHVILLFLSLVGFIFLMALAKKIWYRFVYKKRYYIIPRAQIKGIANIAMVVSMAVALIFTLTIISANGLGVLFRINVGSRISVESILIRIGGVLFGPLLGLLIGAITDLLTVILTSGIFHLGYFLMAMGYGLIAGLVKTLIIYSHNKNFSFSILCTILILILMGTTFAMFQIIPNDFSVNIFIKLNFLPKNVMLYSLFGLYIFIIGIIWSLYPFSKIKTKRFKRKAKMVDIPNYGLINISKRGHNYKERNWHMILVSTLTINLLIQIFLDLFILPVFDVTTSTLPYSDWFAIRFILVWPLFLFNSFILFFVSWIIIPIVKYEYVTDMVEDYSRPLNVN